MAEYKITVDFKGSGGGGSKKEKGYQSVFSEWADNIKEGINDINGGDSKFKAFKPLQTSFLRRRLSSRGLIGKCRSSADIKAHSKRKILQMLQ